MNHPQANPKSVEIAKIVHPRITKAMGLQDCGIKKMNLYVLRETQMPAIFTEGGFMDSTTDIGALCSDAKLKAQGEALAEGLAVYYKLTPTPPRKEDDEMAQQLTKIQQDDMRNLLEKAYKDKVFHVDHTPKVNTMTRGQATDLLISYVARTSK